MDRRNRISRGPFELIRHSLDSTASGFRSNFWRSLTTAAAARAKIKIETLLSNWISFSILLTLIGVYYLFLLSNGTFQLFAPELLDKAFSNMLLHLLHGDFTVDHQAIAFEAFWRDGRSYSYFGVLPAVLRLFAIPFVDIAQAHFASLSSLLALVIFVALQLKMLLIVHHSVPAAYRRPEFLIIMAIATVLSGPQVYILDTAPIYYEPILWSAAMGAAFNLLIIRVTFGGKGIRIRYLVTLAALAGLALNTRASVGVALYLSTTLLVAWTAWTRLFAEHPKWDSSVQWKVLPARILAVGGDARVLLPIVVLGLLAAVAGVVNLERWGNPLTFVNYQYQEWHDPSDSIVSRNYGEFNLGRLWFGALYYATGITYFFKFTYPFSGFAHTWYSQISGPPITPLLTNPLAVALAGIGLYCIWWKRDLGVRRQAVLNLVLIGHASAVMLIFSAMSVMPRYRFDLAPFMTLAGCIGYYAISVIFGKAGETWQRRVRAAAIVMCVVGIISSHYVLVMYKVWFWAVPMDVRLAFCPFVPFACHALGR
jgi:hypothetical protein